MKLRMVGTVAIAVAVAVLSGCSTTIDGEAVSSVSGDGNGTGTVTVKGIDGITCKVQNTRIHLECAVESGVPAVKSVPSSSKLTLATGNLVMVHHGDSAAVCTVGVMARSPELKKRYGITGEYCSKAVGDLVTTTDGYRIGTVSKRIDSPDKWGGKRAVNSWTLTVIELDDSVNYAPKFKMGSSPRNGTMVTTESPVAGTGQAQVTGDALRALSETSSGWVEPKPGDEGSSISLGSDFLGIRNTSLAMIEFGALNAQLKQISAGAGVVG